MAVEIALVEPEIPQNTGNIARTCVALGIRLHLVEPLGFQIDDRSLKRAGLDYWFDLDLQVWPNLDAFMRQVLTERASTGWTVRYATTRSERRYSDSDLNGDVLLVFGSETRGLPTEMLLAHPERCLRLPMQPGNRSLNLSNAVAVLAYETVRQQGFAGLI